MATSLIPVEYSNERVLTTEQLANAYGCNTTHIKQNFNNNKENFVEGTHYFKLEGATLEKLRVENFDLQISSMTRSLYLWTRKGAVRHCKMLNTVKAWEMFNELEESYFNRREVREVVPSNTSVKPSEMVMEIGAMSEVIQNTFGVKKGIALAQSTDVVSQYYHFDLTMLKKLIPPAEHEIGTLTPTDIGKQIGLTPQKVNEQLVQKGLQRKDGKDYRLTDEGKKYGESMPYNRHGHSGYQIKWAPQVLTMLLGNTLN